MRQVLPFFLLIVLAALVWTPDAAAQQCPGCGPGPTMRMGRMGPAQGGMRERDPMSAFGRFAPQRLLRQRRILELTEEQAEVLEELSQSARAAREEAQASVRERREQLIEAWQADQPDPGQVRSHVQAIMQARQAAQLAAIDAATRAKAVLSEEQRGRLQGWIGARTAGRRGAKMHPRGPRSQRLRSFRHHQRCPGC